MQSGAFLVNVGRGSVDEEVADTLEGGKLAGYAADVSAIDDWALPDCPTRFPSGYSTTRGRSLLGTSAPPSAPYDAGCLSSPPAKPAKRWRGNARTTR